MRLTVTIEAEHEEASGVPLEGLLVETMGVLTRMGFQAPGVHSRARRSGPQQPHGEGALRGHISRGA